MFSLDNVRSYAPMLEAARQTHLRLYEVADADIAPTSRKPVEVPAEGFGDAAPTKPNVPRELKHV